MKQIQRFQSEEVLKLLGDSTRLAMLRMLISHSATISQLGEVLGQHPARIRNHIKQMERAGLVELVSIQLVKNYREKYYRATARSFFVNMAVFPEPSARGQIVILGSDDPALELLSKTINEKENYPAIYTLPVGSLDGLIYLREKYCQVSGCHLFDMDSGMYNLPYVRHLFTDQLMILVTLAYRQQGLIVKKGNPLGIANLNDLTREDVRFVNRKRGAGTRLWLDQQIRSLKINPEEINGYKIELNTHSEVAESISAGNADIGLGIFTVAHQHDLDFFPLFEERYDLVTTEKFFHSHRFAPILKTLWDPEFKRAVDNLGGYNTSHMGEIVSV